MRQFHTIVVGAGPGGLTCAEVLARHGKDVLVLEKNRLVGPKVCAGGITWAGLIRYVDESLIEKSFYAQHIVSGWQNIMIRESTPIVATVNRERLGQWMVDRATAAGVNVLRGTAVREIFKNHISTAGEERFGYKYLVGADGSSSIVRRYLGIGSERVGAGIHYQVPGDFKRMEWHLDTRSFRTGYAWIFPHKDSASVGVFGDRRVIRPKELMAGFREWTQRRGINLKGLQPKAALINFDYRGWRFGNKFLVGDAAGLASGLTGEGILPAILSGETAAHTIIDENYNGEKLERLIHKQQKHTRLLEFSAKNRRAGRLIIEALIMAMRLGVIHFSALEMGESG
ncbi:MAG: NAD(P)/FAD-dependent oxidoreductase [Desulfobulbaceae bacterium]|nr:NAD(P)/FAD-dependent oxidoreductase [Desulfobulbaceae bacterium]